MRFSLVLLVLPILTTCQKSTDYGTVRIIGHAGAGLDSSTSPYSSNSAESIEYALSLTGIDGVEVDVQCSASQTAWLYHDLTLDTRANGEGCINLLSDDVLDGLHYTTLQKERLVRLSEITVPSGKMIFLDVRSGNTCTGVGIDQNSMIVAIDKTLPDSTSEVVIITTNPNWVHAFYLKGWKVFLEAYSADAYRNDENYSLTQGICIRSKAISVEEVRQIQQEGKEVLIFDARSPKGIRSALKKMPDFLLADDLRATLIEKNR